MPKSPAASKREVALALAAAKHQARSVNGLLPVLEAVARDSDVSKSILTRKLLGRLTWLVLGK